MKRFLPSHFDRESAGLTVGFSCRVYVPEAVAEGYSHPVFPLANISAGADTQPLESNLNY